MRTQYANTNYLNKNKRKNLYNISIHVHDRIYCVRHVYRVVHVCALYNKEAFEYGCGCTCSFNH